MARDGHNNELDDIFALTDKEHIEVVWSYRYLDHEGNELDTELGDYVDSFGTEEEALDFCRKHILECHNTEAYLKGAATFDPAKMLSEDQLKDFHHGEYVLSLERHTPCCDGSIEINNIGYVRAVSEYVPLSFDDED